MYSKGRGSAEAGDAADGKRLELHAADGYPIGAVFYPALRARAPRRVAVLHGGAGIPALSYRRFASFLAEWGIPVLTYDYRGIGLSRPPELRGFQATIDDWAELDSAAAIAWLRERFPHDELLGISHSIGCLVLGGGLRAAEQGRAVFVGAHTGYYGDYRSLYRWPMAMAWHGMMPAVTRVFGYFPAGRLGLGDDLPAGMAMQWARRLRPEMRPTGSGAPEARTRLLLDRCAALRCPALAVSMSDDAFATIRATQRLLSYFPRLLSLQRVVFSPADANVRRLGHFGFFRRAAGAALWPRLLAQIDPSRMEASQIAAA